MMGDTGDSEEETHDEKSQNGNRDRYEINSWERRTLFDWIAYLVYNLSVMGLRVVLVGIGIFVLLIHIVLFGLGILINPLVAVFTVLSVVPALFIAFYIWDSDATEKEPFSLLMVTFLLGMAFAGIPSIIYLNVMPSEYFYIQGYINMDIGGAQLVSIGVFFFIVVAPVEELVKWFAVRSYAYYDDSFKNAMDGAVYGAFAGLGFATVENSFYMSNQLINSTSSGLLIQTSVSRALAGPLHVVFSAVAGYYLGLAVTSKEDRG
ncbi:MAG: PrsW family glutamic-type intramembrane protease, partial [Halobacteria archaeon]|nr:PrsW family glutamic-type intramembrane protease [Halobacteria archaeon]